MSNMVLRMDSIVWDHDEGCHGTPNDNLCVCNPLRGVGIAQPAPDFPRAEDVLPARGYRPIGGGRWQREATR